jgi:L-serine deaminase
LQELLQNRLAIALHDRAVADSGQLPEGFRHQFVSAFSRAAQGGLEIGGGQTGGRLGLPAGVPAAVVHQLQALAADVFRQAFVDAMHPTLVLPIAVVILAAVGCLGVRGQKRSVPDEEVAEMRAAG